MFNSTGHESAIEYYLIGALKHMAGAATFSMKYSRMDAHHEDSVELVHLVNGDLESEAVDEVALTASSNDVHLKKSAKRHNALKNQSSNSAVCCGPRFQKHCIGHVASYMMRTMRTCFKILWGSKICWLLPAVVLSQFVKQFHAPEVYVFALSLIGIAPLAERLGFVTEQLSMYTGSTVGGLLNATFGNATEMIISWFALSDGLIRVVQLSLLGSILSNMLLVLGCAFFSGGLAHPQEDQKFNQAAAVVNSGLLLMAVMGLLFPAVLQSTHTEIHAGVSELNLSRFSSCIMLLAYASYLYFQLKSHRQLYDTPNEVSDEGDNVESSANSEEAELGFWEALVWLTILTIFISLLSNNLVDAIEGASAALHIPLPFISVIILPIVGNAAEHASAIMFALKDKLDLSLGVAIGSSTQISMFVIPFCVVIGWAIGQPMDLNFHIFETATLFTTVIVVAFMLQEGKANYFKGLMLVLCYLIVGASFFVHVDSWPQGKDTKLQTSAKWTNMSDFQLVISYHMPL